MDHTEILAKTFNTLQERTKLYGSPKRTYEDAATIASTILKKDLTAYDIAMIMVAVKLSRTVTSRAHQDNYEDAINFMAFTAEFAMPSPLVQPAPPKASVAEEHESVMRAWRKQHEVSSAQYAGRPSMPHTITNLAEQEVEGNDP